MKTYLITGTNRGIGLALSRQVLEAGNRLYALARHPEKSKELSALSRDHGNRLSLHALDVTDFKGVFSLAEALSDATVDVLINNAGVYGGDESFEELPLEQVTQVFQTNALGPLAMTQAFLPHLLRSKLPKAIHITSLMGSITDNSSGGYYSYRMSKAALNMFEKCFSIDYPAITSAVVHPGWVQTDMGGSSAPTSPRESAAGILALVEKLSRKDSGKFFDFEGEQLPW